MENESMKPVQSDTLQLAARAFARKVISEGYEPKALHEYTDVDGHPTLLAY